MPVARLLGVVGECDNSYHLIVCYGHNREGEALKNKSFGSELGSFARHGYKRRVWLAESDCRMLKRIDQLTSQAGEFLLIPGGGFDQFFGSVRANLYLQD